MGFIDLDELIKRNEHLIADCCRTGKKILDYYNYNLNSPLEDLEDKLLHIFRSQKTKFKINVSYGFILKNNKTGEYRYYHPCMNNNTLFPLPHFIGEPQDMIEFIEKIKNTDILEHLRQQKPDSSWVVERVTNVTIYLYKLQKHVIGSPVELPPYVLNNKGLISLQTNKHSGNKYNDKLCFFRCLALHFRHSLRAIEKPAKELFARAPIEGVLLEDLDKLEDIFKIRIVVYSLVSNNMALLVRRSKKRYGKILYLNLYQNHFSYIKNIMRYSTSYRCLDCNWVFDRSSNWRRHQKACMKEQYLKFQGGGYSNRGESHFDKIGVGKQFFEYFATFDIECMQLSLQPHAAKKLRYTAQHELLSISVCSNIPGYEDAVCFVSEGDPVEIVKKFVNYLNELSDACYQTVKETLKENWHQDISHVLKPLQIFYTQLPVVGFNSGRYDINVLKPYLIPLLRCKSVIKRNNNFMCLTTEKLKFLDLCNYLAPGYSYAQFLKAYDCSETKGHFPYEYVDSLSKLQEERLPSKDKFFSSLKQTCISDEDYDECQKVWKALNMKTMKDFLVWYNNKDVKPMVEAISKLQAFYRDKGLDIFKDGISVPGLCLNYLFNTTQDYYSLFDKKDLYSTFKNNIVGGPSIIFHRYQEADVTMLQDGRLCKKIVGYDCNALYLWCIMQEMPSGLFIIYSPNGEGNYNVKYRMCASAMEWLSTIPNIRHKYNGGEIKILGNPVDGYCKETKTVYQFHGCFWHGCPCQRMEFNPRLKNRPPMAQLYEDTRVRSEEIREAGYNLVKMWECEFRKVHPLKRKRLNDKLLVQGILDGSLFGFVECDLEVPPTLIQYFSEFPPIFKNCEISIEDVGEHMREYCKENGYLRKPVRSLIGSMFGKKIFLMTPLLKWYLEHGLEITKVYQFVEFVPRRSFERFGQEVTEARKMGDMDPNKAIIADNMKLLGNSAYGKTVTNKEKHTNVRYCSDHETALRINSPFFKHASNLTDDVVEVEMLKSMVHVNLPNQIGFSVYQYAKLRMLQFYYDFLHKYLTGFQLCEMDTDSFYLALPSVDLEIKPELVEEFQRVKGQWLADSQNKRTPGLFKLEWEGKGIYALNSKMYYCFGGPMDKYSCKGANRTSCNKEIFKEVLSNKGVHPVLNRGFRQKDHGICTYEQVKDAYNYLYIKRKVLEDGFSTTHLDK